MNIHGPCPKGFGKLSIKKIKSLPFGGPISAIIAVICFSLNDMCIKFISGDYALHQIVFFRSIIGLGLLLGLLVPFSGGLPSLRTKRLGLHLLRGLCVVFANLCFFLGLASLHLSEGVAIFFISPLLITVFSVLFLKETVGIHRWSAIFLGLVGVIIMLRPGTSAFQLASFFPLAAAFGYASLHMLTRYIGRTESALTMSFYIQVTFFLIACLFGISTGSGQFAGSKDASLEFLMRAWVWPSLEDIPLFLLIGFASAFGGFFISHAYRNSDAGFIAPFEYFAMPLAVFWGYVVFKHWPDHTSFLGMILIVGAGLYLIWREISAKSLSVQDTPRYRR